MGGRGASGFKSSRLPNADRATIADSKITDFLLKPGAKHYGEFVSVGYTSDNPDELRDDILHGLQENQATFNGNTEQGAQKYRVNMELGIGKKALFRTVWQIDPGDTTPRFITAHRIGRNRT